MSFYLFSLLFLSCHSISLNSNSFYSTSLSFTTPVNISVDIPFSGNPNNAYCVLAYTSAAVYTHTIDSSGVIHTDELVQIPVTGLLEMKWVYMSFSTLCYGFSSDNTCSYVVSLVSRGASVVSGTVVVAMGQYMTAGMEMQEVAGVLPFFYLGNFQSKNVPVAVTVTPNTRGVNDIVNVYSWVYQPFVSVYNTTSFINGAKTAVVTGAPAAGLYTLMTAVYQSASIPSLGYSIFYEFNYVFPSTDYQTYIYIGIAFGSLIGLILIVSILKYCFRSWFCIDNRYSVRPVLNFREPVNNNPQQDRQVENERIRPNYNLERIQPRGGIQDGIGIGPSGKEVQVATSEEMKFLQKIFYDPTLKLKSDSTSCCICLGDYETGIELFLLRCGHCFHIPCLTKWLSGSRLCPLCQQDIKLVPKSKD